MNDPLVGRTRFSVKAEIDVAVATDPDPTLLFANVEDETISLSGCVIEARTGAPLAGLRVLALSGGRGGDATKLGNGTSDERGRFRIQFGDDAKTQDLLRSVRRAADGSVRLRVDAGDDHPLFTSEPLALNQADVHLTLDVTLSVPTADEEVPASAWSTLGKHLQQARIAHLNDVVRLLSGNTPLDDESRPARSLTTQARRSMVAELERAFLDPSGALRKALGTVPSFEQLHDPDSAEAYANLLSQHDEGGHLAAAFSDTLRRASSFASLSEVDWVIEPRILEDGNVGLALDKFRKEYAEGDLDRPPLHSFTNLTSYRDYLLAIWTTYAPQIVYDGGVHLTAAQALAQLQARFHQTFRTIDEKPRPANAVLLPIVTAILTAPKGKGFGFGVAPAAIPPQGTRTPREQLDRLIGLTRVSAVELGLRYRLDFTRPDTALSNPVQENIAALQGFFRDGFQCDLELDHVAPDVLDQPIVPDKWVGRAPFFLYFDEWLRQQSPFFPENHLDVRRTLPLEVDAEGRRVLGELIKGNGVKAPSEPKDFNIKLWTFCRKVIDVWDKLQTGHSQFDAGEYGLALRDYQAAHSLATDAMAMNLLQGLSMSPTYSSRKARPLNRIEDVTPFMRGEVVTGGAFAYDVQPGDGVIFNMGLRLAYYALFTLPVCLGDAFYASGDYDNATFQYGRATRFKVGVAKESDVAGSALYSHGDKPFTALLYLPDAPGNAPYPTESLPQSINGPTDWIEVYAEKFTRRIAHLAEIRCWRLRQANVMLEWADTLFRADDATSKARARELYKGVLWLHGKVPPICPTWPTHFIGGGSTSDGLKPTGTAATYSHHNENPALVSQTARAFRAIYQIDHDLNYYGERGDIVPVLRYRPLKQVADRLAAMARGAQDDFLGYTDRVEAAMRGALQLTNLLQRAKLQSSIADEQKDIADHDLEVAQDQVVAVEAAIKAKEDEIADHNTLFGQIGDAMKTLKSIYDGVPDDTKSAVGAPVKAGGESIGQAEGKEMAGKGMLGLGEAGSIMTGFGIFAVAGYVTLTGLKSAADQRDADLNTLATKALPAARAVVEARKHGVNVARYQQQIAQADIDQVQVLLVFEENRLLNQHFWLQLAQVARRLLRRYLELGARGAWLAERALAYEQDRTLRIVRMDYFPARLQGVTGADLMQADLAELEATRIEGMRRTVPVRRSVSLAREFPLQYGRLKTTGRCAFRTEEAFFRRAYPGTSAYRIRAVSATAQQAEITQPLRGSLINRGVSISRPGQPGEHVLVRAAESLPLSEFRLEKDMPLYGLPDERLLTFEGSSVESFWELAFPRAANPAGLAGLVDVSLTFDLVCEFTPERYEADLRAMPTTDRKWILISAAQHEATALAALAGAAASVDVRFDLPGLRLLPRQETSRKITNIAAFLVTPDEPDLTAKLSVTKPATSASVVFEDGFAISSLHPDPALPPLPISPLNVFAGLDPDQVFTLAISKAANPGADFRRVTDVVLAIEYDADLAVT